MQYFFFILCITCTLSFGFTPSPYLPDLLTFDNGTDVTTPRQWIHRRIEIANLLQSTILGELPKHIPSLVKSKELNRTNYEFGASSTFVELTFSCESSNVSFQIEVLAPATSVCPCPLFLTQWNHRQWALLGMGRGYINIVYPGADTNDIAPSFQKAYPNATMALILARAFVASRTLDYALQLSFVNKSQVAITGHSRNGKQSLLAAAFDTRFTAVVGSSPGAPISSPYHFSSSNFYGEGPVTGGVAGKWWLKDIVKYAGHPENLPIDGHGVLGLISPRSCAIATGMQDHEGDITFADEMGLKAALKVYTFQKNPNNIRIIHRSGDHHGFDDVQTYFDWFDHVFDRLNSNFALSWSDSLHHEFPLTFLTPAGFDWNVWNQSVGVIPPPPSPSAALPDRVRWLLERSSSSPSGFSDGSTYCEETSEFTYITDMLHHAPSGIGRQPVCFGEYITANVYYPLKRRSTTFQNDGGLPAVIWLHPYSYATGYTPSYRQSKVWESLTKAGFVVIAYDQIGFGIRLTQGGTSFYARYSGHDSLFGHMVKDARAALDFLSLRGKKWEKNSYY